MTKNLNFDRYFYIISSVMKALFLHFFDFAEHSGISKKILAQVNALRANGVDCDLCYTMIEENGNQVRICNGKTIQNFGRTPLAKFIKWFSYGKLAKFIIDEKYEILYIRSFYNTTPQLVKMLRLVNREGVKVLMEFPTYPYEKELKGAELKTRLIFMVNRLFRSRLKQYVKKAVTFSDADYIHGIKTINISNGIDFSQIKLKVRSEFGDTLNLIGVAEVHIWHGYDRVIKGLYEYNKSVRDIKVRFNIVGNSNTGDVERLQKMVREFDLSDCVQFSGYLSGKELDEAFDRSHFAIASLARHRTGISVIKTIKNREYAARGIPFIFSEDDSDFNNMPYILKASPDESPINIEEIVQYFSEFKLKPEEIRNTVIDKLSWDIQMKRVINSI